MDEIDNIAEITVVPSEMQRGKDAQQYFEWFKSRSLFLPHMFLSKSFRLHLRSNSHTGSYMHCIALHFIQVQVHGKILAISLPDSCLATYPL